MTRSKSKTSPSKSQTKSPRDKVQDEPRQVLDSDQEVKAQVKSDPLKSKSLSTQELQKFQWHKKRLEKSKSGNEFPNSDSRAKIIPLHRQFVYTRRDVFRVGKQLSFSYRTTRPQSKKGRTTVQLCLSCPAATGLLNPCRSVPLQI